MKKAVMEFLTWLIDGMMKIAGPPITALTLTNDQIAVASEIFKYFALLGICLSTVFFLIELNRKTMFEANDLTMKSFIAPFCKYVASIGVLSQGGRITSAVLGWGNAIYKYADTNWNPSVADMSIIALSDSLLDGMGIFMLLGLLMPLLLMMIVNLVVSVVWIYKAFQFKLEVIYRICITPIALADIYSGGASTAIRWLKGWIATILYGVSFIVIPRLSNFLMIQQLMDASFELGAGSGGVLGLLGYLLLFFISPFAALGAIGAVRQLTKEALA